jgi:adenosine deaminase
LLCNNLLLKKNNQRPDELRLATLDLLKRLASQHVVYAEIRFCPALHTRYTSAQIICNKIASELNNQRPWKS